MTLIGKIKNSSLKGIRSTGAFHRFAQSRWRTERLTILCYHGISMEDEHEWQPAFSMTASTFESRLEMLRSGGYRVLPLDEAIHRLYSRTLAPKSVVITFDDGLHNFYTRAFPLLEKYGFPATVYLTTYYCDRDMPIFPLICLYMLWKCGRNVKPNPSLGLPTPLKLNSHSGRIQAWEQIKNHVERKQLTGLQKNEITRQLAEHLELDFNRIVCKRLFHVMTPQEVKAISKGGVDIQLHTHHHRMPLDRSLFHKEILENHACIERITGKPARHFCYPSGVHGPTFLPWLSELGIASATTCEHALADAAGDPLLLPRFLDSSNVSPIEFEGWLTGTMAWLKKNLILNDFYQRRKDDKCQQAPIS